jgi:hypothetical protein
MDLKASGNKKQANKTKLLVATDKTTKPPTSNKTISTVSKQPIIKDIEIKLNNKTKQNLPVYLKAPFKTEPVKTSQRKSLSSHRSESKDSVKVELKSQTPRPESRESISSASKSLTNSSLQPNKLEKSCKQINTVLKDETEELEIIKALISNTAKNDNSIRNLIKNRRSTSKELFLSKVNIKNDQNNYSLVESYYKKSIKMIANLYLNLRIEQRVSIKLKKFDISNLINISIYNFS